VPSVAPHPQNAHRSGFYPITRSLADVWHRLVARDANRARALVQPWADSPFLLVRRLSLFVHQHEAFTPAEAAAIVIKLDDEVFWGNARVEIMRLIVERWAEFSNPDREAIETRIRQGEPRNFYPADAFENDEEWRSIQDSSIYKRLKRIELAGRTLTAESRQVVAEISARHPTWKPSMSDRDDFHSWHETRSGPDGQPELLADVADETLVKEAMRLQRERHFEQGDIWRVFCSADPERALRGLRHEACNDQWEAEAWRCLLWTANENGDASFQSALADLILQMPEAALSELLHAATSWLQRQREALSVPDQTVGLRFLRLWDRFADRAYTPENDAAEVESDCDIISESLNRPGGILAWSLLDSLSAEKPQRASGLDAEFKPRFDLLANAPGRPGLLARVYLVRSLAYLDAIDPAWAEVNLQSRLNWGHPEALSLWRSFAHGGVGSSRLFNALKPAVLEAFERQDLSDNELEGLMSNLLSVAIWHQRGNAPDYNLTTVEVRRTLTVGPASTRRNVSWNLWRMMGDPEDRNSKDEGADVAVPDKPTRWQTVVGPIFRDIWPLDARLRSESTSQNLVMMALECGEAFPEAVDAILDVIVPYRLYQISHSLRLEPRYDELVRQYPLAFVMLTNALIDPSLFPVPNDLAGLLNDCVAVRPEIRKDPAFMRLYGLRRQRNS